MATLEVKTLVRVKRTWWPYSQGAETPHSHMLKAIGRPVAFKASLIASYLDCTDICTHLGCYQGLSKPYNTLEKPYRGLLPTEPHTMLRSGPHEQRFRSFRQSLDFLSSLLYTATGFEIAYSYIFMPVEIYG